ncbi:MAG: PepSY-associated TM helix domain-containing protein [Deferribacteres bacterium]|nr:PepSY-associated TM helix domain-containing protein [candidate division KSB1 bacterium]MCB9503038.1 PepSY-associated TM helix domain-containing protein [Deferribacteres bacterium]
MKWRKWNRIIHRDLGYIAFGLTMVYAISGFAVNHIHDWNSNYTFEKVMTSVGPVADISTAVTPEQIQLVLQKLDLNGEIKNTFPVSPEKLQIFLEENSIMLEVKTGEAIYEKVSQRPGLFEMNVLHLNKLRGSWTLVADIFAVVLIVLAISGIIMIKGAKGLAGRGKWLTAAGIVVPIVYLWIL